MRTYSTSFKVGQKIQTIGSKEVYTITEIYRGMNKVDTVYITLRHSDSETYYISVEDSHSYLELA